MTGDPILGSALATKDGLSLPQIWQQLHSDAREWQDVPRNSRFYDLRGMIDDSDRKALLQLRDTPVVRWQHLCHGAGWTPLGAIALSWCKGVSGFQPVAEAWAHSGVAVMPCPQILRSVAMSNPAILPRLTRLSEIIDCTGGNGLQCALLMAAAADGLRVDLDDSRLRQAPPEVRPMLDHLLGDHRRDV